MTELRRITGLPSKAEADKRIAIWKATPGSVPGTDEVEQAGSTWTASMQFEVAADAMLAFDWDAAAGSAGGSAGGSMPMMGLARECPSCGADNLSSAVECSTCGARLGPGLP
ncbi:MAG: zinc ribbon domain-containing protein [Phycisphaerales bacterium]|nr:zinc ribbon domain-containing protein [Phycisphaerales bacterium]